MSEAQELEIQSFKLSLNDIIAKNDQRKDYNGSNCALVKIQMVDDIDRIEGNIIGEIVDRGVEKWIYLSQGTKEFRVFPKKHLPISIISFDYGIQELESNRIYVLRLNDNSGFKRNEDLPASSQTNQESPGSIINDVTEQPTTTFDVGGLIVSCPRTNGAEIVIDGMPVKKKRERTYWIGQLKKGKHTITLSKKGFLEYSVKVEVIPGDTVETWFPQLKPEDTAEPNHIYEFADIQPSFPNGKKSFIEYLKNNIIYPEIADDNYVDGLVDASFVVEKDGSITDVIINQIQTTIVRGLLAEKNTYKQDDISKKCSESFKETVLTSLQKMPKWSAAMRNSEPVRFRYYISVLFGQGKLMPLTQPTPFLVNISGRNTLDNLYTKDKKKVKEMHLYQVGNECWISEINKNIMDLSDDEMNTISDKSKDAFKDVVLMKEFLSGKAYAYDFLDGYKHPNTKRPDFNNNGLDNYMKKKLENSSFDRVLVTVSYIVETDGTISCPIVEKCSNIKLASKIVKYLRNTKGWISAQKDESTVRARVMHTFAYRRIVTFH